MDHLVAAIENSDITHFFQHLVATFNTLHSLLHAPQNHEAIVQGKMHVPLVQT